MGSLYCVLSCGGSGHVEGTVQIDRSSVTKVLGTKYTYGVFNSNSTATSCHDLANSELRDENSHCPCRRMMFLHIKPWPTASGGPMLCTE
jgi:hypothetical protein